MLPPHLEPCVAAWRSLQHLDHGIRPSDISAHLDVVQITDPSLRRRIYSGVMALEAARREWYAEQTPKPK